MPIFEEVSRSSLLAFGMLDCYANEEYCVELGIQSYPTVLLFSKNAMDVESESHYIHENVTEYSGERTVRAMEKWIYYQVLGNKYYTLNTEQDLTKFLENSYSILLYNSTCQDNRNEELLSNVSLEIGVITFGEQPCQIILNRLHNKNPLSCAYTGGENVNQWIENKLFFNGVVLLNPDILEMSASYFKLVLVVNTLGSAAYYLPEVQRQIGHGVIVGYTMGEMTKTFIKKYQIYEVPSVMIIKPMENTEEQVFLLEDEILNSKSILEFANEYI